jgi:F0F1-type ATP synthase delta subunit
MAKTKRTEIATAIAGLVATTKDQHKLAQAIAAYLVANHQTKDLDTIMRDVMTERAKDGVVEAQLTTAFPLSSGVKQQVETLLKQEYPAATQLVYQENVRPEVLSGIKIQTPDKQLDETARGKLDQLIRMKV